jgi:hypothetical protein
MAYATAADLRAYIGATATTDDTQLSNAVTRAQTEIERQTHRVFEAAADTTRYYTPLYRREVLGDLEDDGRTLWLGADLCALTSITNGNGTAVSLSDVVTIDINVKPWYAIRLKDSANIQWTFTGTPEYSIAVVGRFAYSTTPPADIVSATLMLGAYLYRRREGGPDTDRNIISADGVLMAPARFPTDVSTIIKKYVRHS